MDEPSSPTKVNCFGNAVCLLAVAALTACGPHGPALDGGSDAGVPDAGADAGSTACLSLDATVPAGPFDLSAFLVDGGVPIEAFPQALAARVCADVAQCLPLSAYEVASCEQEVLQTGMFCDPKAFPGSTGLACIGVDAIYVIDEFQSGRLGYDPATAAACLGSPFEGCEGPVPWDVRLCANAVHGLVPDGGACFLSNECSGGEQCQGPCGASTCTPRLAGGLATCDYFRGCDADAGLACNGEGYCVLALPVDGGMCDTVADCPPGLVCGGGAGGTPLGLGQTCHPLSPPVSSCTSDLDCDFGLSMYCADGGTCELPRIVDGGACTGAGCAPGLVCRGYWSVALADGGVDLHSGACGPASDLGGPCVEPPSPAPSQDCAFGLACSCGLCAPAPQSGACGPGSSCGVGYVCDLTANSCQPMTFEVAPAPNCTP